MAPNHKSNVAGNSDMLEDMLERSHKVFPLNENGKILDSLRKENTLYAEIAKIYGKNKSSVHEIRYFERK